LARPKNGKSSYSAAGVSREPKFLVAGSPFATRPRDPRILRKRNYENRKNAGSLAEKKENRPDSRRSPSAVTAVGNRRLRKRVVLVDGFRLSDPSVDWRAPLKSPNYRTHANFVEQNVTPNKRDESKSFENRRRIRASRSVNVLRTGRLNEKTVFSRLREHSEQHLARRTTNVTRNDGRS